MNPESEIDFKALVSQTQIAHRLIAGFYQRLLPTIRQVAQKLDLSFYEWDPVVTARPCRRSSNPADYWYWDMVPMMASMHRFVSSVGPSADVGDVVMELSVTFDSHYSDRTDWGKWGIQKNQQPDPIKLPLGQALVEIYLGRCEKCTDQPIGDLWAKTEDYPTMDEKLVGCWQSLSPALSATCFQISLAEFVADPNAVVEKIRAVLELYSPAGVSSPQHTSENKMP